VTVLIISLLLFVALPVASIWYGADSRGLLEGV
jgi:hypothetical protein